MTPRILPVKLYVAVFAALLVLLGATVAVSYVSLGAFNVAIALTIAVCKMILVMLFFMHVRYSGRVVWIYVGIGFFLAGNPDRVDAGRRSHQTLAVISELARKAVLGKDSYVVEPQAGTLPGLLYS